MTRCLAGSRVEAQAVGNLPLPANCFLPSPLPYTDLVQLRLQTSTGNLVFEEANRAPLELEVLHFARLLPVHGARWHSTSESLWDETADEETLLLELSRQPP